MDEYKVLFKSYPEWGEDFYSGYKLIRYAATRLSVTLQRQQRIRSNPQ